MNAALFNPPRTGTPDRGVYAGVALLAAASLLFEIYLTRVYALMVQPYMAFIVVSVALLGLGAAGTALALAGPRAPENPNRTMALCALAFGAAAFVGTAVVGHFPASFGSSLFSPATQLPLVLYYLISGLPFFFVGYTFALMFRTYAAQAARLYFCDLGGAAAGALAVVATMNVVGGAGTLAVTAALAAAAAAAFGRLKFKPTAAAVTLGAGALVAAAAAPAWFYVRPAPQKFLPQIIAGTGARVERSAWNALGRVDLIAPTPGVDKAPLGAMRGLSTSFRPPFPEVKWFAIDGGAETPVVRFDGDFEKLGFLDFYLPALIHGLKPQEETLIIGPGGGIDVLAALRRGARRVAAVELNPDVVAFNRDDTADFNGRLFYRSDVDVRVGEGRSYLRSSRGRYDVIQLSLVDTLTAATSGAYALSENYVYTVEGFRDYYRHLKPGGVLTVTRNFLPFPHEELRLVTMAYQAWAEEGEPRPENCFALFTNGMLVNILVKRGPFTAEEITTLKRRAAHKFDILWLPGEPVAPLYNVRVYSDRTGKALFIFRPSGPAPGETAALDRRARDEHWRLRYSSSFLKGYNEFAAFFFEEDKDAFYRRYFYNVRPPRDDKPFYFMVSKWRHLYASAALSAPAAGSENPGFALHSYSPQALLLLTLAEATLLAAAFLLAPLGVFKRHAAAGRGKPRIVAYFIALGVAFMLVEITIIQKLTLYLGHPVYAFAVGLATLLGASGLGSLASTRFKNRPWVPFFAVAALAVVHALALDAAAGAATGWPLPLRVATAVATIFPLGFFLGMPFPFGLGLLAGREAPLIPWAWAANGFASVIGPVLVVLAATIIGHNGVMLAAAVFYPGAFVFFALFPKPTPGVATVPGNASAAP